MIKLPDKLRTRLGLCLLILIILMNVVLALKYYNISRIKLSQFFILQTNVQKE